jgi:CRISPR/Cas system-associated exonuclease Cas4 (RecB family)
VRHPDWLPPHLSVSQVTTYLMCPRKYLFRYIDRLEPEERAVALALGSAVHATLGWVIEQWFEDRRPREAEVAQTFRADWTAETAVPGVPLEGDEAEKAHDLGLRLVEAGVGSLGAQTPSYFRSEVEIEAPLWDPIERVGLPVPLLGYLDFDGDGFFGEIKTVSRKTSWRHWSLQLGAYSFAWEKRVGRTPEVRLLTLQKGAAVVAHEERFVMPRDEVHWAIEVITQVYHSVTRSAFHPNPSFFCTKCEYRRACRA